MNAAALGLFNIEAGKQGFPRFGFLYIAFPLIEHASRAVVVVEVQYNQVSGYRAA